MARKWTPEQRARQSKLIRQWKPWEQSTGPKTVEGKAAVSRNGWKGGHWLELRNLTRALGQHKKLLQQFAKDV